MFLLALELLAGSLCSITFVLITNGKFADRQKNGFYFWNRSRFTSRNFLVFCVIPYCLGDKRNSRMESFWSFVDAENLLPWGILYFFIEDATVNRTSLTKIFFNATNLKILVYKSTQCRPMNSTFENCKIWSNRQQRVYIRVSCNARQVYE